MKTLLSTVVAISLLAGTAAAQEEGAGEYAAQVAPGNQMHVAPGIYADTAARLNEFFAGTGGARTVFATDLKARIEAGVPQFILDVRPATDFAKGHVPGAVNIPLAVLFKPENLAALPLDGTPIILICHTGHTASMALGGLVALGYNPYVLRFAMMGWSASSPQKIWTATQTQTIFGLGGPLQ